MRYSLSSVRRKSPDEKGGRGVPPVSATREARPETQCAAAGDRAEAAPQGHGTAAALMAWGWVVAGERRLERPYLWAAIATALALLVLAIPIKKWGVFRRMVRAPMQAAAALLVLFSADRVLAAWEERAPAFGAAAAAVSAALNVAGYRTTAERGLLLVDHPEGLVTVLPSMEKLALRPFLLFWVVWAALWLVRERRRAANCALIGLATTLFGVIAQFSVLMAIYIEHDSILVGVSGASALGLFGSPWITGLFLLISGVAADRAGGLLVRGNAIPASLPTAARRLVAAGALLTVLGAASGCAWFLVPPGREKGGRLLIDDRFCGIWEPTARQLDTQWYGDFPTYSFTSLAEWLGKWFVVDANTSRPYDDELLSRYEVLIIKTPEEPIPDAETAAIDRFVHRGGGLLLVGDHTNLLGMGTHLNAICARYGIRFRYDSVSDGVTGGFVNYVAPQLGRHVGARHVEQLQFMTSCSIQLSGAAEPILCVNDCQREPHDYAGSSFFGRRGPHPEMEHGRTVLAATVRVGRGRIAAFTDSTVWSSFAVFSDDREKLAMDLVRLLNRARSPGETPLRWLSIGAALIAGLLGAGMIRRGMALPAMLLGLGGFWFGAATAEALHGPLYASPEPNAALSEITFLWQGGACAFPSVLGSPGSLPADRSFDTLLVSVQRLGLVPRVAYTYDDLLKPETRAMVVVAPVNTPPTRTLGRLKDFVRRGGNLVVIDDSRIGERGSAKDFLGLFDATITYHGATAGHDGHERPHVHLGGGMQSVKIPAEDAFMARKAYEQGQVVYMSDAADFSRQRLGHCFARPWKSARARYETIYALFRDVLRIAPADRRFYGIL